MQKKNSPEMPNAVTNQPKVDRRVPQTAPAQNPSTPPDAGSLGQVRDILLGPLSQSFEQTVKQMEQRVEQMDKHIEKMMREHTEKTSARLDALEKRTDERITALSEDVKRDRNRNSKASEQVKQECDAAVKAASEKLEQVFKDHERAQSKHAETTRTKMNELSTTLTDKVDAETSQLRGELVDRASLAAALSEVALRLSGTPQGMAIDSGAADPEIDAALANLGK